jgi:hypothetical protein
MEYLELFDFSQLILIRKSEELLILTLNKRHMERSELQSLKLKVKPLILRLYNEKSLTFNQIARAIHVNYDAVVKWKEGISVPRNNIVKKVVESLEKLLEELEYENQATILPPEKLRDLVHGYKHMRPGLVITYFDSEKKTESYTGEIRKIGAIVEVNGSKAIIAYPNDSILYEDAEGLIPVHDPGSENDGSIIAMKRIDIKKCQPGFRYFIIDRSNQNFFRTLYNTEDDFKYRLVSDHPNRYPDVFLHNDELAVIFRVITILSKPR